jgi:hypothetical protein
MYLGTQFVMRTTDNGESWQEMSPDLTAKTNPPSPSDQGVLQYIAPSGATAGVIWVGTSNGLVQLTRDNGATWSNVTPSEMPANSNITLIEASPANANTAYVISAGRNDSRPYIFRTRDAGKTWSSIAKGLPAKAIARVVREDPQRKGLLYGGTENGVYISYDDGDHWQSLQLNLPTVSVRDLDVHGNDLVAATYGRSLWILDDISPLRQVGSEAASAQLFKPANAVRTHWDVHPDTPVPNETAHGENPPDGTIIDYYLKSVPKNISLEIRDARGNVVRRFSDKAEPRDPRPKNVPEWWFEPPTALTTNRGLNRFVWNLQWAHPDALTFGFRGNPLDYIEYTLPDHAVVGKTPVNQPPGPFVMPGTYEVVLTVDGKTYRQPLVVEIDPRVKTSMGDLQAQFELALAIDSWMNVTFMSYNDLMALGAAITDRQKTVGAGSEMKQVTDALNALKADLPKIAEGTADAPGFGAINRDLARYVQMIQSGDNRPAKSASDSAVLLCRALTDDVQRWRQINERRIPEINQMLGGKTSPLPVVNVAAAPGCPN